MEPKAAPKAPEAKASLKLPTPGLSPKASPLGKLQVPGAASPSRLSTSSTSSAWKGVRGSMFLGGLGRSNFFTEKQALVISFGQAYTKVGLAGESRPRAIFRTPELRGRERKDSEADAEVTLPVPQEEWVQILDGLLNRIFFQYLHLSPKDRRIIVCESVYSSTQFRKALAFVLFKLFSAPAVCFVLELVLPLYLTGLHSGLVVDLGYDAARVLPTFAGVPLLSAYSAAACGVRRVLQGIKGALVSLSSEERKALEDETVLEDVLVCACYVSCDFPEDSEFAASSFRTDKDAEVRLVGRDHGLRVPAACRDIGLFFKSDKDATREDGCECETLPEAFVRALELSPVDLRSQLVQNIVVCGGAANLRGLLPRLALELQKALEDHKALGALAEKLRFTPMDFAPVSAAWTGGAIFGALEGVADYSAEDFHKGEPLPDWLRSGFL